MEEGHWFVSVYNDDGDEHNVVLVPQNSQVTIKNTNKQTKPATETNIHRRSLQTSNKGILQELTEGCVNGCHGHGACVLGKCQCHPGFDGDHCSQSEQLFIIIMFILITAHFGSIRCDIFAFLLRFLGPSFLNLPLRVLSNVASEL